MIITFYNSYLDVLLNELSSNFVAYVLYDCCFKLAQAIINIIKIMIYFLIQVVLSIFNAIAFGFGKIFLNTLYWAAWIAFHFACGILGLEDKSTSAFSWLFLVFILALYCERNHQEWFFKAARVVTVYHYRVYRRLQGRGNTARSTQTVNQVLLENQRNEHRETEPINRLLEAENQENENEENNLVEADRHRIDNDNRRNIEREYDVDDQRASLENHQNVERELHNTRTSLDNRRNRDQEQRYFLRQRVRNHQLLTNRLAVSQPGINAVVLPAITAYNMLPLNRNDFVITRSNSARLNV